MNVAIENGQVCQVKEQFFRPLECAPADGVTVGHSVTLIHTAHMTVIIHHSLRLYGFSCLVAEITFHWGIVNICQHVYVPLLPRHTIAVKSATVLMRMSSLFSFVVFGLQSCGVPCLFGLTVPQ